jgi:polyisoprenoid-binding protein YceI
MVAQSNFRRHEMSIIEEQQVTIPEGTFNADPVHSSVAFDVQYMGIGTFGGNVKTFQASLVRSSPW